jgi:hypothetical protein
MVLGRPKIAIFGDGGDAPGPNVGKWSESIAMFSRWESRVTETIMNK